MALFGTSKAAQEPESGLFRKYLSTNNEPEHIQTSVFPPEAVVTEEDFDDTALVDAVVRNDDILAATIAGYEESLRKTIETRDLLQARVTLYQRRLLELEVLIAANSNHLATLYDGVSKVQHYDSIVTRTPEPTDDEKELAASLQEMSDELALSSKAEQEALRDSAAELSKMTEGELALSSSKKRR